jgi:lipid A 3-O-deacylase
VQKIAPVFPLGAAALILMMVGGFGTAAAASHDLTNSRVLGLHLDNDQIAGSDRSYTSGLKLSLVVPLAVPSPAGPGKSRSADRVNPETGRAFSLTAAQHIFTPEDLARRDPIPDDRPYAGLLYVTIGLLSRRAASQQVWELTLGMTGPASGAEKSQKWLHDVFNLVEPRGWDHQLRNQAVAALVAQRKWKSLLSEGANGWGLELIPHIEAGLGNLYTYARTGAQLRLGRDLTDDFGASLPRPDGSRSAGFREPGPLRMSLYAAVDGMYVLRDILLDGKGLSGSPQVDRIPWVATMALGAALTGRRVQLNLEYFFWSKRFEGERRVTVFGSLSLVFMF